MTFGYARAIAARLRQPVSGFDHEVARSLENNTHTSRQAGSCKHEQEAAATRPPRFYVPVPLPAAAGELVELDAEESRHAAKALRLAEGDAVELCDGAGSLLLGCIASVGKKAVTVEAASAPRQVPGCEWSHLKSCRHT
jgi:hypothetical protein